MNYKRNNLSKEAGQILLSLKDSWRIVLLTSIFICGLIIGAYAIKSNNSLLGEQLNEIIKSAITKKESAVFIKNFLDSFVINTVFLMLSFSLGLCAIGAPAICLIPLIKGFGIGITGAYIYLNYSIKGVCYCLFVFFPAQILISAILIFACNEGFYMSEDLFSTVSKGIVKEKNLVRLYLTRFMLLLIFSLITSVIDASLSKVFSSIFTLF